MSDVQEASVDENIDLLADEPEEAPIKAEGSVPEEPTPTAKEEPYLVEHEGKEVAFSSLPREVKEAIWQNHNQKTVWQKSFTKKNQDLAELERGHKSKMAEAESAFGANTQDKRDYTAFKSWLRAHPDDAQALLEKMNSDPTFAPVQQQQTPSPELTGIKEDIKGLKNIQKAQEYDQVLQDVVKKYGDYDVSAEEVDKHIKQYQATGFNYEDMSDIFTQALLWEKLGSSMLKNAKEKGVQSKIRKTSAGLKTASTPTDRELEDQKDYKNIDEAFDDLAKKHGNIFE